MGDLIGWGADTVQGFEKAQVKDIPSSRPFDGMTGTIYTAIDKFVPFSADADWPAISWTFKDERFSDIRALEPISPKAVKGMALTAALVRQSVTRTGDLDVDKKIENAKKVAIDSLINWAGIELFADVLIAREKENDDLDEALKVICGATFTKDNDAMDKAFEEYDAIGPKLGHVTMQVWGWLAPEVHSTVFRIGTEFLVVRTESRKSQMIPHVGVSGPPSISLPSPKTPQDHH